MQTPRTAMPTVIALLALLLVPFSNCAPGKAVKGQFVELSVPQKISSVLESDRFTVALYELGAGANVVYTAVFNRRMGVLIVDNSSLSADGGVVSQRCAVTWNGGELGEMENSLRNVDLISEERPAVQGRDSWLEFVDRKGHSFRVHFEGSSSSATGGTVITGGQFLKELFAKRGTCPT